MPYSPRTTIPRIRLVAIAIGLVLAAGAAYFFILRSSCSNPQASNIAAITATIPAPSSTQDQTETEGPTEDTSPLVTDPDYGAQFERRERFNGSASDDEHGDVVRE